MAEPRPDLGGASEVLSLSLLKREVADYQYSELRLPRSIRLLHLQSGAFNDEIECSLHSANLDESPIYSALSYTWGNPQDTVPITCDNHRFNVTVNLAGALRRLRSTDCLVVIWVDAICIDQTNIDERNSQVRLMKDIFSRATWVTVYLGEETEDTPLALDLLKLLYELSKLTDRRGTEEKLKTGYMRGSDPEIPQSFSPHWDALQNFFRREYFSRIWVVQEVALSSSDPIVLLGEHRMTWGLIYHAAAIYHTSEISGFRPEGDQSFNALLMQDYRLQNSQRDTESWTLLRLLGHTRGFRATDPRDKVFALLCLANDIYDQKGSAIFEPDYHASLGDVCHSVAQRMIVDRGVIDVLSYCSPSPTGFKTELPSWAPDWTFRGQYANILGTGLKSTGFGAASKLTVHAQLSSDNRILELHGYSIDVVSTVFKPAEHQFDIPREFREPGALKRIWDEVVMTLGESYVTGGSTVNAFWRTLIANLDINVQPATDDYYIHFLSYWRVARLSDVLCEEYRQTHSSRPSIDDYDAVTAALQNDFQSDFTNTDELAAIRRRMEAALSGQGIVCTKVTLQSQTDNSCEHCEFLNRFDEFRTSNPILGPVRDDPSLNMMDDRFIADWFRRLREDDEDLIHVLDSSGNTYSTCILGGVYQRSFIVTSGKLIGIAPANTQVGDKVAIIAGAQMPFILRPRREISAEDTLQFTLVGEAYVHGVMDGSFVKLDEKNDPLWDTISLI